MTLRASSSSRRTRRAGTWPAIVVTLFVVGGASSAVGQGAAGCGSASAGPGDAGSDAAEGGGVGGNDTVDAPDGIDALEIPDAEQDVNDFDVGPIPDAGCSFQTCPGNCLLCRCVFSITSGGGMGAGDLAVLDPTVYWTVPGATSGSGQILSLPITTPGATPAQWAAGQDTPQGIAVNGLSLFWANDSPTMGSIAEELLSAAPRDGGMTDSGAKLDTFAPDQASPTSVVLDDANVYWTATGALTASDDAGPTPIGFVFKKPLAGGNTTALATEQAAPGAIAVDSMYVYWVDAGLTEYSGAVLKVEKGSSGGKPVTLARSQNFPSAIAVGQGSVYWSQVDDQGATKASVVMTAPIEPVDGGTPQPLRTEKALIGGMVADSTNLYWTVGGGEGAGYIVSVGLGGSIFSTIVTGLDNPGAVTWDATSLYWIDTLSGSVTSVTPK